MCVWFSFISESFFAGNAETECDASDGTNVKCKFFEDISSTRTNFALYFYYENGKTGTSPLIQSPSRFFSCLLTANAYNTLILLKGFFSFKCKIHHLQLSVCLHAAELLADCSWLDDNLDCIEQKGVKCKQPVSDVAEIILPIEFASRPGAYGCMTETLSHENIKLCRSFNTQSKVEEGQNDVKDQNHPKENGNCVSF